MHILLVCVSPTFKGSLQEISNNVTWTKCHKGRTLYEIGANLKCTAQKLPKYLAQQTGILVSFATNTTCYYTSKLNHFTLLRVLKGSDPLLQLV